jgi:Bacterial SH3 domain
MRGLVTVAALAALLTACGAGSPTATPLPVSAQGTASPGSSPSPSGATSKVRTVLSPLGLNLHASASVTAQRVGSASQGTTLTVKSYSSASGGWYEVQGATTTGWIVADPTLSAPGYFQAYSSSSAGFAALYPQNWTFAEETSDVLFRPQSGQESIVVTSGSSSAALGPEQLSGYAAKSATSEVVCGVTANLTTYAFGGTSSPTPASGSAALLANREVITLKLDGTHYLRLAYNYSGKPDEYFADFYNSVTFPFPQCEQTTTPTP